MADHFINGLIFNTINKMNGQFISTAGTYFVMSRLAMKEIHASCTFGNAPNVDILVCSAEGAKSISIQVKTAYDAKRTRGRGEEKKLHHLEFNLGHKAAKTNLDNLFFAFVDLDDIIRNKYDDILCRADKEINIKQIERIMDAKKEISEHYKKEGISPTATLISKILLGTLGCVPAYDRLLKDGLSNSNLNQQFNKKSLAHLFEFVNDTNNNDDFKVVQKKINSDPKNLNSNSCYYPLMKIVDMYFWEVGQIKSYL